jgi:hypothetical protein
MVAFTRRKALRSTAENFLMRAPPKPQNLYSLTVTPDSFNLLNMRKKNIFNSEEFFVGIFILPFIILALALRSLCDFEKIIILSFALFMALLYKLNNFLKRVGFLKKLWDSHVVPEEKNRLSVAILVMFSDTLQVFIFLVSLFISSSIFLYIVEFGRSIRNWWPDAIYRTIESAGIGKIGTPPPCTNIGRIIYFCNFFIGLIFIGLWVAIWTNAFRVIFQYFKETINKRRRPI